MAAKMTMTIVKSIIRSIYRSLLPASVRTSSIVTNLKVRLLRTFLRFRRSHDWIYNSEYYERSIEGPAVGSAKGIASSIFNDLKAIRVIDVGCGTGALLEALRDRGCEVFGLEYSEAALKYCRSRRLSVAKFDLEKDVFNVNRTFDVAVSMEVAEHLPEMVADRYVDLLTRLSQVVVLTAAPPGQGGPPISMSNHLHIGYPNFSSVASHMLKNYHDVGVKAGKPRGTSSIGTTKI